MRSDSGAVDHAQFRKAAGLHQRFENLLPKAALAPAVEAIENRCVWSVFIRQRPPTATLSEAMHDAAENAPVILAHWTGVHHRKMRLDLRPLLIGKPEPLLGLQ